MITDSCGLQEEAVCANKRVLVCRDTTERPETIECGLGKLIDTQISYHEHNYIKLCYNEINNYT